MEANKNRQANPRPSQDNQSRQKDQQDRTQWSERPSADQNQQRKTGS